MNLIQKYFLYLKLINPGPTVSVKKAEIDPSFFSTIDWSYRDGKNTYQIKSVKGDTSKELKWYGIDDFYLAKVYLNGEKVTEFIGGFMAKNLYHTAAAVMHAKSR